MLGVLGEWVDCTWSMKLMIWYAVAGGGLCSRTLYPFRAVAKPPLRVRKAGMCPGGAMRQSFAMLTVVSSYFAVDGTYSAVFHRLKKKC